MNVNLVIICDQNLVGQALQVSNRLEVWVVGMQLGRPTHDTFEALGAGGGVACSPGDCAALGSGALTA